MKSYQLICLLFLLVSLSLSANENNETITANLIKLEQLFLLDEESLNHDTVIQISSDIIKARKYYTNDSLAKTFILLANVANNRGDSTKAFQFATDGLSLRSIASNLRLNLLSKAAEGYFYKGKFHKVAEYSITMHELAITEKNLQYEMLALGFKAMASALLGDHNIAAKNLSVIQQLTAANQEYAELIPLLEIIATAYYYLNDFSAALNLYEKILKLRFNLNKHNGVGNTYYNLAASYQKLGRLDDAYNAFWESKKSAEAQEKPILIAYADLGLGQVLLEKKKYLQADKLLNHAEELFKGQNLTKPYVSTLIALAQTNFFLKKTSIAKQKLLLAERLALNIELTQDQIILFQLLANIYQQEGEYEHALQTLQNYIEYTQQFSSTAISTTKIADTNSAEDTSRNMALEIAKNSDLSTSYKEKFKFQRRLIITLISIIVIFTSIFFVIWLKNRQKQLYDAYNEVEKPAYILASSTQTKHLYQQAYKQARKYQYTITIGYITIINWQELMFRFNKKVMDEVAKNIAILINDNLHEFDHAGLIIDGEYLFIYPHQNKKEANEKLTKLVEALKVRFFANLGEFSVNIAFSIATPSAQDIDPYIFLSRLSEIKK